MKRKLKNALIYLLSACFMLSNAVFANGTEAVSQVVVSDKYTLGENLTFTKESLVDSSGARHTAFAVEFNPKSEFSSIAFLNGENLNTRTTVTGLIENHETDGTVVAAMNADFFNMSTGLAESIVISGGNLLTSDRDNYAFSIDADGMPFIDKPSVSMVLTTPYGEYTVLHYNKEFTEYGLYLYSQYYGNSTRISVPSKELILAPYSESYDYEEMALFVYGEQGLPFDLILKNENDDGVTEIVINERYKDTIDTYAAENGFVLNGLNFYKPCDTSILLGSVLHTYVVEVRENKEGASHEIPEGCFVLAANAATQVHKIERVVVGDEIDITFNCNEKFIGIQEAIGCGALIVNNGEKLEHTDQSHYASAQPRTAIGITEDGRIIMFAVDGRQSGYSKGLTLSQLSDEMIRLGCKYAANLDGGGSTVVKAVLPQNRKMATVSKPSDKSERKVSNAIAFYNLTQPDGKIAYSYLDSPNHLVLSNGEIALGKAYFTDKNHFPVDTSEKEVNDRENKRLEQEAEVTDDEILKELLEISSAYESEETQDVQKFNYLGFIYTVDEEKGIVENDVYKPNGFVGNVSVISHSPDGFSNEAFIFTSLDEVDSIKLENAKDTVYEGDIVDINAAAYYKGFDVASNDNCFNWKVDKPSASVDEQGMVTAAYADTEVKLSVSFGNTESTFMFRIKELPFVDIKNNWAKENIITLYESGISNGELTENGRMYFPSRTFTRSEFCVMLSRLLGYTQAVDTVEELQQPLNQEAQMITEDDESEVITMDDKEEPVVTENDMESDEEDESEIMTENIVAEEAQVPNYTDFDSVPVWAKDSITALYINGYLDGFSHIGDSGEIFDGTSFVTRREVIRLVGKLLDNAPGDYEVDLYDIYDDDPDLQYIKNAIYHGIFKGYLDGTLRPDSYLTRAEVSAVFIRLSGLI